MSADNTQETSQDQSADSAKNKGNNELESVKAQLAELLESQKATMEAVATVAKSTRQPEPKQEDLNLYEPQNLRAVINQDFQRTLQAEQAKQAKIAEMTREYPEISSDTKLMSAIVNELKNLPEGFQQTPAGYEAAILKVVTKENITPKSRRQTVDDDISMSGSGNSRRERKQKVAEETLAAAALMGIDVSDPEVVKRLEKNSQRNYNRYE